MQQTSLSVSTFHTMAACIFFLITYHLRRTWTYAARGRHYRFWRRPCITSQYYWAGTALGVSARAMYCSRPPYGRRSYLALFGMPVCDTRTPHAARCGARARGMAAGACADMAGSLSADWRITGQGHGTQTGASRHEPPAHATTTCHTPSLQPTLHTCTPSIAPPACTATYLATSQEEGMASAAMPAHLLVL